MPPSSPIDVPALPATALAAQAQGQATSLAPLLYLGATMETVDRQVVLSAGWQLIAHQTDLAAPGDHVVAEVAGVPLLAVRDTDGTLRVMHNVCRHRAAPLARCNGRGARELSCMYHGWVYGLDGRLRHAPGMAGVDGFEPEGIRLPPVRSAVWHGLVFAAIDDRAPPLAEVVAGIDPRLPADLDGYRFERRTTTEVQCNWKVWVDNFLEGYQVGLARPSLHRALSPAGYATSTARWHSLQDSPLLEPTAAAAQHPYGSGRALYYYVWPNTLITLLPGCLKTQRVLPSGPDACRVVTDDHYAPGGDPALAAADATFSSAVRAEDVEICEAVQRGLASGVAAAGRLNPSHEVALWHFHELLRAAYRGWTPPG